MIYCWRNMIYSLRCMIYLLRKHEIISVPFIREAYIISISGTRDGEKHHWKLVRIDGVWYHLDLLASSQFRPMTEEELTGYEWDRDSIPAE